MPVKLPSDALDDLTKTFARDRDYCDALMSSSNRDSVAKILVYYKWARHYLPHIQTGLVSIAEKRFPESCRENAKAWTAFLTGGVLKDICLIPYLVLRGVFSEAGFVIRRSLEHVGVLTHVWEDPSKAEILNDADSPKFQTAFIREVDKSKCDALKARGIGKRFAAYSNFAKPASDLYRFLSSADVHGGIPLHVVRSLAGEDAISCGFVDRRDPGEKHTVTLLTSGVEILCVEMSALHGKYGKRYDITPPMVGEGGRYLAGLLSPTNEPSPNMVREIAAVFHDLGLSVTDASTIH